MKNIRLILKLSALCSLLILVSGFAGYRAGLLNQFVPSLFCQVPLAQINGSKELTTGLPLSASANSDPTGEYYLDFPPLLVADDLSADVPMVNWPSNGGIATSFNVNSRVKHHHVVVVVEMEGEPPDLSSSGHPPITKETTGMPAPSKFERKQFPIQDPGISFMTNAPRL